MKKKSTLYVLILAVLLAAGLWYTRPQSVAQAVHANQADLVDACLCLNEPYQEGTATYYHSTYVVLRAYPGEPAMDAVLAVLEAHSCRYSIWDLIPHGDGNIYRSGETNLNLVLGFGGRDVRLVTSDLRKKLTILDGNSFYDLPIEKAFFEDLSAVVLEYGVPRTD